MLLAVNTAITFSDRDYKLIAIKFLKQLMLRAICRTTSTQQKTLINLCV